MSFAEHRRKPRPANDDDGGDPGGYEGGPFRAKPKRTFQFVFFFFFLQELVSLFDGQFPVHASYHPLRIP